MECTICGGNHPACHCEAGQLSFPTAKRAALPRVRSTDWVAEADTALTHALKALSGARNAQDKRATTTLTKTVKALDALITKHRASATVLITKSPEV